MRNWWMLLSLALLFPACSESKTAPEAPAPVTLSVASAPAGELVVDGEPVGRTPVENLELAPGRHELVIRREGFADWTKTVDLPEAEALRLDARLIVADPTDPAALAALAEELELEAVEPVESETMRSGGKAPPVLAVYPRGTLLDTDLDEFRVDVTEEFEPGGKIEFRMGRDVLFSMPFDPESFATVLDVPEKGRPVTAKFKVRTMDSQRKRRVEKLDERTERQPELLRDQMRAQLWLNKRLYYAAYRDARSVVRRAQSAPESLVIMQAALRRLDLEDTALWAEIEDQVERLPSRWRSRFGRH